MTYHVDVQPDVWTILASIGTVVALISIIISLWLTRKGQNQERQIAENTALRAEAAARLTEGYTQRVVDALEAIARSGLGNQVTVHLSRVSWSMVHEVGSTYRLTNTGEAKAWNVQITTDESLDIIQQMGPPDLDSGEARTFMAAPDMGTTDYTVTVTWDSDENGTEGGTWRYPLPMS